MTPRRDRVVLMLETLLGVVPITLVGGGYSILGVLFGSASVVLAIREHAFNVFALWFGILALAGSGLFGIIGLWALIAVSAGVRSRSSMTGVALTGSAVGVLAALITLLLLLGGIFERRPLTVYLLVAPILVVVHRGLAIARAQVRRKEA